MEAVERTDSTSSSEDSSEDEDHYQLEKDELLISPGTEGEPSKTYVVDEIFGRGTFGTVVRCWDSPKKTSQVAVKLSPLKNKEEAARNEAELLFKFKDHEDGHKYVIQVTDFFIHKEYACLVMETMEMPLDEYMFETTDLKYLDLKAIKRIIHDVLMGLAQLQQMGIIHADIKPENIMLSGCGDVQTLRAKIIDFGLAHLLDQQEDDPFIQTLPYRSPEVIMYCLPYCEAIDVWSAGCILGELLLKRPMYYDGRCEYDQLRYYIENQGPPPQEMIKQSSRLSLFFTKANKNDSHLVLRSPEEFLAMDHEAIDKDVIYPRNRPGFPITTNAVIMPTGMDNKTRRAECRKRLEGYNLMQLMLKWDPKQRISAGRAVKHPFFQQKNMEPSEACHWDFGELQTALEGVRFVSSSKSSSSVHSDNNEHPKDHGERPTTKILTK